MPIYISPIQQAMNEMVAGEVARQSGTPATPVVPAQTSGGTSMAGTYSPYYGGIPVAPTMQQAASGALTSNLANLGSASQLASQSDAARWASYISRFPAYNQLAAQESQNINYMLGGGNLNVPWSQQAAKNLYGGYSGSGLGANLTGRAVEEYALKNQTLGTNLLTQIMGRGQAVPTIDLNMYGVTPSQNYAALLQQAIYGAAPIPAAAATAAQQAALQGLLLGRQSTGTPTATGTTTPTAQNQAIADLTNMLRQYMQQGTGQPEQPPTTAQQALYTGAYDPTYDYSAGMYSTPYTDQGVVQGPYEGTGEGSYYSAPSYSYTPGYNDMYWPEYGSEGVGLDTIFPEYYY